MPESIAYALSELLDEGEASSIALALSQKKCLLILDDLRARRYATKIGLNILGTIGVIARAEKRGIINNAIALVDKIQKTNFRLSDKIIEEIRRELK